MSTQDYESFESRQARQRLDAADAEVARARHERDQAIAELEKIRRDIGWMMRHGLIRDVVFHSDQVPAGEQPCVMEPDPEDFARLRWLNQHGRVSMGGSSFTVSFDHGRGGIEDDSLPTPYNIRHLIDLCRTRLPQ